MDSGGNTGHAGDGGRWPPAGRGALGSVSGADRLGGRADRDVEPGRLCAHRHDRAGQTRPGAGRPILDAMHGSESGARAASLKKNGPCSDTWPENPPELLVDPVALSKILINPRQTRCRIEQV